MSAIKIDATCPMCDNWSGQWDNMAGWTCLVCAYTGSPETFLGWSGSVDNIAPPESMPEQDCRRCRYFLPPDPKLANYKQSESVMSCEVCIRPRNFETFAPCGIFKPKAEPPTKAEPSSRSYSSVVAWLTQTEPPAKTEVPEMTIEGRTLLEEIRKNLGRQPLNTFKTKKETKMRVRRFIVRSFLRTFRHSLFVLAFWKAAELIHWAWPGLKMAGRMLYPPIYAVARAIHPWLGNAGTATSGQQVVAIWIGIIIVAAVAIFLLWRAWLGLNRLARAAFAAEQA